MRISSWKVWFWPYKHDKPLSIDKNDTIGLLGALELQSYLNNNVAACRGYNS